MSGHVDVTRLTKGFKAPQGSESDDEEALALGKRAREHLDGFSWCDRIVSAYTGAVYSGILGVFLFNVVMRSSPTDEWLWVIVGDVPPAHLVTDDAETVAEALEAYVFEMREWVTAVREGSSLRSVIPVNTPPTLEYADMLDSRLSFIESNIIPSAL